MPKFDIDQAVAWSHKLGAIHAEGSIIKLSVAKATDPDAVFGKVIGPGNAEQTHFIVSLEGGEERVLTGDELVRVAPEE